MSDLLRILIVDDEAPARRIISKMITRYCPGAYAVASAGTLEEASAAIRTHRPDLILLDVELRGATGFDLLEQTNTEGSQVVFITAYAEYAVEAFRVAATDYLVKPVEIEQLQTMIERVRQRRGTGRGITPGAMLLLPGSEGRRMIAHDQIVAIEADGSYSKIALQSGEEILVVRKLGQLEHDLPAEGFLRCHRSYLINLGYLHEIRTSEVVLSDGRQVPVSRARRAELNDYLKGVS